MTSAEQVLELAATALPGADIEVIVDRNDFSLTRFANSFIHQNVTEESASIGLRAHLDGRTVGATTTSDVTGLIERVRTAVKVAPLDPGWPGLAPAQPLSAVPTADPATASASPDSRAGVVQAFVEAAGGLSTAGYCRTTHWTGSYRNSAGQALDASATSADMDGIARLNGADGVARRHSARLSDLDGAVLGASAAKSARAQTGAEELEPGRYEVVLLPEAVSDLLANFAFYGFNGKFFNDGRCFAELGEAQFDPAITVFDDPFEAGGRPFDQEGSPRSHLTLVESGVTRAVAHDRRSAAEAGARSTGHAVTESWGPTAVNMALAGGSAGLEQMIASMRRGILVSDLWYTRVLDPRTLVLTGLTRNGVWLVENGEIVKPLRNFRFTQGYVQALGPEQVLAVGAEVVSQPNRKELTTLSCPALHLASWNFTGGASG